MIDFNFIAGPVIGGLIGLMTNGLAIKMLFRPLKPIKIGKYTLPFTPGLIPKEKPRIAKAIGKVIGEQLLDADTLQRALASEGLKNAFDKKVDSLIEELGHQDGSVEDYLDKHHVLNGVVDVKEYLTATAADYLPKMVVEKNLSEMLVTTGIEEVIKNLNGMVSMVAEPALNKAKPNIIMKLDEMVLQEGPGILENYIDQEYHVWMDHPMAELGVYLWQKKAVIRQTLWDLYLKVLQEKAAPFIIKLDVGQIVENKINEFDTAFLEKLIMEIASKELHALVWLGGVLGAIIGLINSFV
ncbi:MAG: DUF445 family protein [Lachnospiraceae bacterium]|nr:DUF445 family protein [Candidatus Equihabitans merdae]